MEVRYVEIVNHILTDKRYDDIILKIFKNPNSVNDIKHDIILILYKKNINFLYKLYEKNELIYYITNIIKYQKYNKTSDMNKKYKFNSIDFLERTAYAYVENDIEEKILYEILLNEINLKIEILSNKSKENKRDMELFKMYISDYKATYRSISKKTNIPLISIFSYINNAKKLIKKEIDKNDYL